MINDKIIRQALRSKLIINEETETGIITKDNIAYEGRSFNPDEKTLWLRETYLPVNDDPATDSTPRIIAIMQYDVFVPTATGTETAEDFILQLKNLFNPDSSPFVYGSLQIIFNAPTRLTSKIDGKWHMFPLRVSFSAYLF